LFFDFISHSGFSYGAATCRVWNIIVITKAFDIFFSYVGKWSNECDFSVSHFVDRGHNFEISSLSHVHKCSYDNVVHMMSECNFCSSMLLAELHHGYSSCICAPLA
jgi:hypothetical protein